MLPPPLSSGGSAPALWRPSASDTRRSFWQCGRVMRGVTARATAGGFFALLALLPPPPPPAPPPGGALGPREEEVPGDGGSPVHGVAPSSPPGGRTLEKFPPYSVPTMKESRESCEMMDPRESKAARSALVPDAPLLALLEQRGFSPAGRSPALVPRSFATASFCNADIAPSPRSAP